MSNIAIKDLRCVRWTLDNPDTGILKATILNWKDAESVKGKYDFSVVSQAIDRAQQIFRAVQLRVDAEIPSWSVNVIDDFISFIRAVGCAFDHHPVLFSIDMTIPGNEQELSDKALTSIADAYMNSFLHTYKLVEISNERIALYLKEKSGIGLVLDARKDLSAIGEKLARLALQKVWETAPVRMIALDLNKSLIDEAIRWHVSSIDTDRDYDETLIAHIGYRLELRRVAFPQSGLPYQAIPLSAWIINNGNAPCYNDSRFRLSLSRADSEDGMMVKTTSSAKDFYPGEDMILSETITLSNLSEGEYDIQMGLFEDETDFPISLGIEGRISDGYYATLLQLTMEKPTV